MAKDLMKKLKGMQKSWKESEPARGGFGVPDGTYNVRIDEATLCEAKQSGRLQIKWVLVVIDGDYANKKICKFDGMDDPKSLPYVQGSLEALELEIPDDITEIGTVLEEAVGKEVEIQVRTKDEFTNIYFNGLLEAGDSDEEEEEDAEDAEDEDGDDAEESDDDDDSEDEDEDSDDDEDSDEEEEITKSDVLKMDADELAEVIKANKLKIKKAEKMKLADLRKAVAKELF